MFGQIFCYKACSTRSDHVLMCMQWYLLCPDIAFWIFMSLLIFWLFLRCPTVNAIMPQSRAPRYRKLLSPLKVGWCKPAPTLQGVGRDVARPLSRSWGSDADSRPVMPNWRDRGCHGPWYMLCFSRIFPMLHKCFNCNKLVCVLLWKHTRYVVMLFLRLLQVVFSTGFLCCISYFKI